MRAPTAQTQTPSQARSYLDWARQGKATVPRYLTGFVVIVLCLFLLGAIPMILLAPLLPDRSTDPVQHIVGLLSAFPLTLVVVLLLVRVMHRRPSWSVAGPRPGISGRWLLTGLGIGLGLGMLNLLVFDLAGVVSIRRNPDFDVSTWLVMLVVAGVGILVQATTEEVAFRGYLTQMVWAASRSPWVALPVAAVFFAVPHLSNVAALGGGWLAFLPYFANGLFYGIAAYRTGSIWLGAGLHWANNLAAVVLLGVASGDVLPTVAPLVFAMPTAHASVAVVLSEVVVGVTLVLWLTRGDRGTLPRRG